jgi:RimJ/RimL family protein N-acetyltransferase
MRARRATLDDAEDFAAVVAAVADEGRWIATEPGVDVDRFAERVAGTIAKGADVLWVLEDDGAVIGTMSLHPTHAQGVMALGMCVLEGERGRGGGRALLAAAIAYAQEGPLHKLELEVWPDNERAIALYEACGFEREGVRRAHYRRRDGSLRSSLIMARRF